MTDTPTVAEKKAITIIKISPSRQANKTFIKSHQPELGITKDEQTPCKIAYFNSAAVHSPFLDDKLMQKILQQRREKAADQQDQRL